MTKQRARAREWHAAVERVRGRGARERRVAKALVFARAEALGPMMRRVYRRSHFATDEIGPLADDDRPPPPTRCAYYGTWAAVLLGLGLACAYLLQRATVWGRRNTLTWLEDATFALWSRARAGLGTKKKAPRSSPTSRSSLSKSRPFPATVVPIAAGSSTPSSRASRSRSRSSSSPGSSAAG